MDTPFYFIPLGVMESGNYKLSLEQADPGPMRVEVISERFEPLVDTCVGDGNAHRSFELVVEEHASHYLRLRSPCGLRLIRLEIEKHK